MAAAQAPSYKLFYWPFLPGRGEFVRLMFAEAGVEYEEVARKPAEEGGGPGSVAQFMRGSSPAALPAGATPGFAPPFLIVDDKVFLSQTHVIMNYLAPRLGLVGETEEQRAMTLQVASGALDVCSEVYASSQPLGHTVPVEEQREHVAAACRRFCQGRLEQWLGYFDAVVKANKGEWLMGDRLTFADLALYYVLKGCQFAFPTASSELYPKFPAVVAIHDRVAARPRIAAYTASDKCLGLDPERCMFKKRDFCDFSSVKEEEAAEKQ